MIETSSVPPRKPSAIFGKCSKSVRRRSSSLRNNLRKSSEIFGKSSKTSLFVCLYNKQNNTWTLGDMEFIFSCSHSISHSFGALTRSISMWTLEDKFHISARPCIILYIIIDYNCTFLCRPLQNITVKWPNSVLSGEREQRQLIF